MQSKVFVTVFISILVVQGIFSMDIQFDRIEMLNASYVANRYNVSVLRISKIDRTTYGLNMEFETFRDMTADHLADVRFFYKRLSNNEYSMSLAQIPKMTICEIGDKYYNGYWMTELGNYSNLPQLKPKQSFCPLVKVHLLVNFSFQFCAPLFSF